MCVKGIPNDVVICATTRPMTRTVNYMDIHLDVPQDMYAGQLQGLCGNMNGDRTDDMSGWIGSTTPGFTDINNQQNPIYRGRRRRAMHDVSEATIATKQKCTDIDAVTQCQQMFDGDYLGAACNRKRNQLKK